MPPLAVSDRLLAEQECLIQSLSAHLAAMDWQTRAQTLVVLPTKRLVNWLNLNMAWQAEGQATMLPTVVNMDQAIDQLIRHGGIAVDSSCGPIFSRLEIKQHLQMVLAARKYPHLGLSHCNELIQLFFEMLEFRIPWDDLQQLQDVQWWHHLHDDHSEKFAMRVCSVIQLFKDLSAHFSGKNGIIGRKARIHLIEMIQDNINHFECPNLLLAGFTSIPEPEKKLFLALHQRNCLGIWAHTSSQQHGLTKEFNVSKKTSASLNEDSQPLQRETTQRPQVTVTTHPSPESEVNQAVAVALTHRERGLSLNRLAVIVTDETLYGPLLRRAFATVDIPVNFGVSHSFVRSHLGRWVQLFFRLLQDSRSNANLADFLNHPLSAGFLSRDEQTFSGHWSVELCREENLTLRSEHESIPQLKTLAELLLPLVQEDEEYAPDLWLASLFQVMDTILEASTAGNHHSAEDQMIAELFEETRKRLALVWNSRVWNSNFGGELQLPGTVMASMVEAAFTSQELRPVGSQLAAIQVLGIEEARHVPFQKVLLLGAAAELYPSSQPSDSIVNDAMKKTLGLPGWRAVEEIEEMTFKMLAQRVPELIISWPQTIRNAPTSRSRFLLDPEYFGVEFHEHALQTANPMNHSFEESHGSLKQTLPGNTRLLTSRALSTSALESLLRCPWRFALERMKIRSPSGWTKPDFKKEGDILHKIVEQFFLDSGPFGPLIWPDEEIGTFILHRLNAITETLLPEDLRHSPLHLMLVETAWPGLAHLYENLYTMGTFKQNQEVEISYDIAVADDLTLAFKGRTDAVFSTTEGQIVLDYKRSGIPDMSDLKEGLVPQLVLYALGLGDAPGFDSRNPDLNLSDQLLGYFSLLKGQWTAFCHNDESRDTWKKQGLTGRNTPDLEEVFAVFVDRLNQRVDHIIEQNGYPIDSTNCGQCRFDLVCRKDYGEVSCDA